MWQDELFVDIYADHGCDLAPSCLDCPLIVCKYDEPKAQITGGAGGVLRRVKRNREIIRLREAGMLWNDIIEKFGITERTVARIIANGGPSPSDLKLARRIKTEQQIAARIEKHPSPYRLTPSSGPFSIKATQLFKKRCPRCQGDVQVNSAIKNAACMQCGRDPRRAGVQEAVA